MMGVRSSGRPSYVSVGVAGNKAGGVGGSMVLRAVERRVFQGCLCLVPFSFLFFFFQFLLSNWFELGSSEDLDLGFLCFGD